MKINKKYVFFRLITFPLFLAFNTLFMAFIGALTSFQWLIHGGQMLFYGSDNGKGLVELIKQNKELLNTLNNE